MIQLDAAHFSNLTSAVQRTGSLTGGAVRGLPNDVVIDGLHGVQSYGSAIAEAQKEFQLGRARTALERVRQLETSFSSSVGQWNGTVNSIISGAKQGRQAVPAAKLNEVRNAQTRMQVLVGPATKAFRDLISALEFEISLEGHQGGEDKDADNLAADDGIPTIPEPFTKGYHVVTQLHLERGGDNKARVVPQFEPKQFYLLVGDESARVVRVDELNQSSLAVYDFELEDNTTLEGKQLIAQLRRGVWAISREH
ncbi:hypothetical protein [Rhodopirellula sp. MGV]|uniref:hypothetical protein n=1 Tax=Rhodopirellula sp. MGV TaxID=2023130 RepID=UPI000B96C058|nr:hypothetical protein [Rhodopirellula sp. MGV]OYP33936.1 hypothetical protein CGZ80_17305 [Rhodopirellula sp. MGV]PNY34083.1 hypothetical protein C2E31_25090 [Rhodopirellula baltica]